MRQHTQQPAIELETFCSTCPPPQEVSELLTKLGFRLAFQMDEQPDRSSQLPPLPAQYHYKDDASGTEVIYLAGRDTPLEGEVFPCHASRFWLSAGADVQAFQRALSTLALAFQLTWRDLSERDAQEQVEVA